MRTFLFVFTLSLLPGCCAYNCDTSSPVCVDPTTATTHTCQASELPGNVSGGNPPTSPGGGAPPPDNDDPHP